MSVETEEIELARKIAGWVGNKWSLVEVEDLQSELVLWLFENEITVNRYRADPEGYMKLNTALRKHALKYCAKEQSARSGALLDHDAKYSIAQVKRALPYVFEDINVESYAHENPHTGEPVGVSSSGYGLALAVLLDMRICFEAMPKDVKEILTLQYRDGLSYREISELTGVARRTAIRQSQRAVSKLRDQLCGYL